MLIAPNLEVSLFQAELTPPERLPLGGYTARGNKKLELGGEPLFANAIRMSLGKTTIVVVSTDMLTIPESLVREVRARIPKNVKLFLAATHTHSAPDSQMLNDRMSFGLPGIAKFEPRWLAWYAEKIAGAVNGSLVADGRYASTLHIDLAHVDANRGRRRTVFPDKQVTRIWVDGPGWGRPIRTDLWTHYSAHAVFFDSDRMQTSRDWPGGSNSIRTPNILLGAIGDVSPVSDGADPEARIHNFWKLIRDKLCADGLGIQARHEYSYSVSQFDFVSQPIDLDPIKPNPDFAKSNKIPQTLADTIIGKFAPTSGEVSAFRIGKLCVVGIPGEPTSALGKRIRDAGRNIGFDFVLVCSHVNGWIGYILEADDYASGGYEASLAFHGPGTAQKVYDASVRAMNSLAYPNRTGTARATSAKIPRV